MGTSRLAGDWRVVALGVDKEMVSAIGRLCRRNRHFTFVGGTLFISTLLFVLEERHADLVIVDQDSLRPDTLSALASIHRACPQASMLIVGDALDALRLSETVGLGVRGLVHRAGGKIHLKRAMEVISRGEIWLTRIETSQLLIELTANNLRQQGAVNRDLTLLTPRENRVLQQCLGGHSNKEIAQALGITEQTVKIHLQHIYQKLHVRRRTDLLLHRWAGDVDAATLPLVSAYTSRVVTSRDYSAAKQG
jgi:DNA-binding NarL/FixJ family response regulator